LRAKKIITIIKVANTTKEFIALTCDCEALAINVNTFIGNKDVPGGYNIIVVEISEKHKRKLIRNALKSPSLIRGNWIRKIR